MDRYGEVYTTLNKILEGIYKVPESNLVLNGDESLLGKLMLKIQMFIMDLIYQFNENNN